MYIARPCMLTQPTVVLIQDSRSSVSWLPDIDVIDT
jgi:hypothetical protein